MKSVQILTDGPILHIVLSRPEKGNALNDEMMREISKALDSAGNKKNLRAVLIRSVGKSFCTGADLDWFSKISPKPLSQRIKLLKPLEEMYMSFGRCRLPIIVRAHGWVAGGGVGILCAADFAVAETQTKFCLPEAKHGLIPGIASPFIVRRIGVSHFSSWAMSGETISSAVAKQRGLVSFTGSSIALDRHLNHFLQNITLMAPHSIEKITILNRQISSPWKQVKQLDLLSEIAKKCGDPEARAGFAQLKKK